MKRGLLLFLLGALTLSCGSARAEDNSRLNHVMKLISQDLTAVAKPANASDPTSVTDGEILLGVLRARVASLMVQQIYDRRGSFFQDMFFPDEFTPGDLTFGDVKAKQKLKAFGDRIQKLKSDVVTCEKLLEIELKKKDYERDFTALKDALPKL